MTTETNDGSIESVVDSLLEPTEETVVEEVNETEEEEVTAEQTDTEEVEEDEFDESEEDEFDESEDDVDDEETDADQFEPETFTVKVDGEEVSVTLDDLKQGYSGQKYVQKGMQEAAAQRKQAEEVYAALVSERQKIAEVYQQLQQGGMPSAPTPPSDEMLDIDPIGYMQDKARYDKEMGEYQQKMAQLQQVAAQESQAQQQATQAHLQREMQSLQKVIPEFADPAKARPAYDRLVSGGVEHYGYKAEDFGSVTDHRALVVLNDALRYREMMNKKQDVQKKTRKAKPVIKPGSKKVDDTNVKRRRKRKSNLKRTGSIDDALELIMN